MVPMCMRMFALIRIRVHLVAVQTWGIPVYYSGSEDKPQITD